MLLDLQVKKIIIKISILFLISDEPEILLELVYSEPISTDSECTA
jgi:hypothetical protein